MYNAGDFNTTETVELPLNSFSSDDPTASVTMTDLAAGDVFIYPTGSITQRASASGVSVVIDHDSHTGSHVVRIDLSDNDDPGFYANGTRYLVKVVGVTVDGGTINAWIGGFSIGCTLRPATAGRTVVVDADGLVDSNTVKSGPSGSGTAQTANDNGADINAILNDTGTDGVKIADDAITSAKFDESTAFPLKSADSGDTEIARTGADGDTLEDLSDQLDGISLTADDIITALWAKVIDTTRTFGLLMKHLMAFIVGNSLTNRTAAGVEMTYYAEDGETTQMKASITETGRTITEEGS